jgi:phage terminase large subunit
LENRKIDVKINQCYFSAVESHNRYLILYGGAGSGKSYFACQKFIARMTNEPNHRFLFVRKVARTIRNSQFKLFKDLVSEYGILDKFVIRESEMGIVHKASKNEIISAGCDDIEKLKSIQGVTGIWIEETTELTEDDFQQIDLRLRGETKNYKQIIMTFNPISALHWLKRKPFEDSFVLKTTYHDNNFIDNEYKQTLENLENQNLNLHRIYALGEWGVLEELIYRPFELLQEYPTEFDETYYGLDFGFNNPTALIKVQVKDQIIYLTEMLYKTGLTNSDVIKELERLKISKSDLIYCDSAEPGRIEDISRAGYLAKPSDKSVKDGIDYVKTCKIFSNYDNKNLNNEVLSYSYKKDKSGNVIDEPVKFNDHLLDALRYALYTHNKKVEANIYFV